MAKPVIFLTPLLENKKYQQNKKGHEIISWPFLLSFLLKYFFIPIIPEIYVLSYNSIWYYLATHIRIHSFTIRPETVTISIEFFLDEEILISFDARLGYTTILLRPVIFEKMHLSIEICTLPFNLFRKKSYISVCDFKIFI